MPQIYAGDRFFVLDEDEILPTNQGLLEISVRVIGAPPPCQRLHSYIKFEWDIQPQLHVQRYRGGTFQVFFTTVPDYLRDADKAWGFIDNQTVVISQGSLEKLFEEKFENFPQWVLLTSLKEAMWYKVGVEAIFSTMGIPLEAKYIATPWGHGLHACEDGLH